MSCHRISRVRISSTVVALTVLACACGAAAHVEPVVPQPPWQSWNADWWLWLCIGASGWLYMSGVRRLWHHAAASAGVSWMQVCAFAVGWLTLILALLSPLDTLGGALFCAHMVQHELLMIVAAPLLILGHPLGPFVWALPASWRKPASDLCRTTGLQAAVHGLTRPLCAWIVCAAVLWLWHIPVLFDAALASEAVHALQHACFFVSALLFWWALFQRRAPASRYGLSVFYVFTTGVHSSMLGALLTFSGTPWYLGYEGYLGYGGYSSYVRSSAYLGTAQAFSLTPLEDQQLGGLIMWIPGGLIYLAVTLVLMAAWLRASERELLRTIEQSHSTR
jgi:putative membrane protein